MSSFFCYMKNSEKIHIFLDFEYLKMSDTRTGVRHTSSYDMSGCENQFRHPLGSYGTLGRHPNTPSVFSKILIPAISGFRLFLGCLTIVRQYSKMRTLVKKSFLLRFYKYVFDSRKKYFGESYCPDFSVKSPEHTRLCLTVSCVSDIAATGDTFLDVRHN